jgi:FkbM family methyltransferase
MSQTARRSRSPALRAYRLVNRPYYSFRPQQLVARLRLAMRTRVDRDGAPELLRTAWGSRLYCWPDSLGLAVARTGVYDLTVAETLARLADPGETAVDAGANVGLMSNLLAHAVGPRGRVISFEPHPLIFQTLARNAALLQSDGRVADIEPRQAAVSSSRGTLPLSIDPQTFAYNKGTASLQTQAHASATADASATARSSATARDATDVQTVRLDDELAAPIGVMKLDVEMHELQALRGASSLLSRKLIRDIVFEEHEPPPTAVTQLLHSHGYTILGVRQGLTRPIASAPERAYRRQLWDPPALLATTDAARARERLARFGWRSLRSGLARRGA